MSKIILNTVCENLIFSGVFGINENGDWPECDTLIEEEYDEEELVVDECGTRPSFVVSCPKCGCALEWPHNWEIVTDNSKTVH